MNTLMKGVGMKKKNCIVRANYSGVYFGDIHSRKGSEVVVRNARRLYWWEGAATLSQLAMEGVSKPDKCKFPREVDEVLILDAIEIIPCTKLAIKSIKGVKVWSA